MSDNISRYLNSGTKELMKLNKNTRSALIKDDEYSSDQLVSVVFFVISLKSFFLVLKKL